jgi:hypothetical protein
MASELNVRDGSSFFTQNVSFLGQALTIRLSFNSTDRKWRIDISNKDGAIIEGALLVSGASPTKRYSLDSLKGGNFWVLQKTNTDQPLEFNNLGFNKDYGLYFLTTAEETQYGL